MWSVDGPRARAEQRSVGVDQAQRRVLLDLRPGGPNLELVSVPGGLEERQVGEEFVELGPAPEGREVAREGA